MSAVKAIAVNIASASDTLVASMGFVIEARIRIVPMMNDALRREPSISAANRQILRIIRAGSFAW